MTPRKPKRKPTPAPPRILTACLVLFAVPLGAQILHSDAPLPSFEVATIKPSTGANVVPSLSTPAESRTIDVTARNLIEQAYRVPWTAASNERVLGGPAWIDGDRYDIDARIDPSLVAAFATMSMEQRRDQASLRMQSLLADRFHLKVHFESRELPIYTLTIAKGGPRLTAAAPADAADPANPVLPITADPKQLRSGIVASYHGQAAELIAKSVTIDQLVRWLSGYSEIGGRTIVNQTGLAGTYDFTLRWTRENFASPAPAGEQTGSSSPTEAEQPALFTSLPEQLGLRLTPGKGPVEVIVIDHIEKPTAN